MIDFDLDLKKGMSLGQAVDVVAEKYFELGADAFSANLLALGTVYKALSSFGNVFPSNLEEFGND